MEEEGELINIQKQSGKLAAGRDPSAFEIFLDFGIFETFVYERDLTHSSTFGSPAPVS